MSAVLAHMGRWGRMMLLGLPVWLAARGLYLLKKRQKPRWGRELLLAVFVLYSWGLCSQTLRPARAYWPGPGEALEDAFLRWQTGREINLLPLDTIRRFWYYGTPAQKLVNLVGNVVVFMPLGMLIPVLWPRLRSFGRTVGLCFAASFTIEFCQQFIGRSVDVDDLILNTLGGLLGWLLFQAGRCRRHIRSSPLPPSDEDGG